MLFECLLGGIIELLESLGGDLVKLFLDVVSVLQGGSYELVLVHSLNSLPISDPLFKYLDVSLRAAIFVLPINSNIRILRVRYSDSYYLSCSWFL